MRLATFLSVFAALLRNAYAADVVFATEAGCTGEALFGGRNYTSSTCVDLSDYEAARSVIVANLQPAQIVTFYADAFCNDAIDSISQDTCYTDQGSSMGSFLISMNLATTKELAVASNVKLSNYTGLAVREPYAVSRFTRPIGLIGIAIVALAASPIIANAISTVGGCVSAFKSGQALSTSYCVLGAYSTVMGLALPIIYAKYGTEIKKHFRIPGQNTSGINRRAHLEDASHEYLLYLMNITSLESTHVGSMERENYYGETVVSPLFAFEMANVTWHMAAFMDPDSGEFTHHIHHESQTTIAERSEALSARSPPAGAGFNQIKWTSKNAGIDFGVCSYSGAYTGWDTTVTSKNYDQLYDQLSCSRTPDELGNTNHASIDVQNKAGTIIGDVEIVFDKGTAYSPPRCASTAHPPNDDCVVS